MGARHSLVGYAFFDEGEVVSVLEEDVLAGILAGVMSFAVAKI